MKIFEYIEQYECEQLVICHDAKSGLKAIIAIHDTTLGPALGGARMWPYESEEKAIEDAVRLAQGMTYKNAAAGLNLGGGKTVIIGDARKDKNPEMFLALGRFIEGLKGRYITAEDVGSTEEDMNLIREETQYVVGTTSEPNSSGNPSPVTAYGIYQGMRAAAKEAFGSDSLAGKTIAVQGVGNVAFTLCEYLHEEGAKLIVTDINEDAVARAVEKFGATAVKPDEIYAQAADIFAPCALGAVVNDETIPQFKVKVIAGSANNQLKNPEHGVQLQEKGIVYAPDFVINAGGVINVADELEGYNRERAFARVGRIYDTLGDIFAIAKRDNISTSSAANRLAEQRIEAASSTNKKTAIV